MRSYGSAASTARPTSSGGATPTRSAAYQDKQAAWYDERARVLAAVELLPPDERGQLHALAARGPAGTPLSPGAPLYVMNLVRVYKTQVAPDAAFRINEIRNADALR